MPIEYGLRTTLATYTDVWVQTSALLPHRWRLDGREGRALTASKMTSNVLATGLYAPSRIVLYENEDGGSTFEYDLPSAQFGQFDNADVLEVGKILDEEIEKALKKAAN